MKEYEIWNCGNCRYYHDGCQHPEYFEHKDVWGELEFENEVDCIYWEACEECSRELPACIIDIFEDFLDEKGVRIDNPEKEGAEDEAVIYGNDFDRLMDDIIGTLKNFGIKVKEEY